MSASGQSPAASTAAPLTLATRPFPPRVRRLLGGLLEYASDELERGLAATLNDLEQQLFKLAEQSRSNAQQATFLEALRTVKRGRSDLVPRYLVGLESALAGLRDPSKPSAANSAHAPPRFSDLALVEESELHENTVLAEISGRAETRASLPLYLLGQRFGVLAGRPAFDPDLLPIGPLILCRILGDAGGCLELVGEHRLVLLRAFERQVLAGYAGFVEAINTYLAAQGVLPHLQFVPVRANPQRRQTQPKGERTTHREPAQTAGAPLTRWPGEPDGADRGGSDAGQSFDLLRRLLAGRRDPVGRPGGQPAAAPAPTEDVQSALDVLQRRPATPVLVDGKPMPRRVTDLKQDLLAQLRVLAPAGPAPALSGEDSDAIDLVDMLFDQLMQDVRPNSPAAALLTRLQVPLLRVALRDKGFFSQQRHPARQMLNAIAETGVYLCGENDPADRGLIDRMQHVVDRSVQEYTGDVALFETLYGDLAGHLQTAARKADVAEKRHVEAARGKEKLAIARVRAGEAIDSLLEGRRLPKFLQSLLMQAWTDVMALTALRHGEDSAEWKRQIAIARRLTVAAAAAPGSPEALTAEEAGPLRDQIGHALAQVGYHADEALAIAQRLTVSPADAVTGDDPASRTELAMKLKARARLGETQDPRHDSANQPPLSAQEQAFAEQVKQLPFGTWFEFVLNQRGDRARRRLSWYSTVTNRTLFVNHRGQRAGEYTIDWLARSMAREQVRVVQAEHASLIDRAWSAVVGALRSFAGRVPAAGTA